MAQVVVTFTDGEGDVSNVAAEFNPPLKKGEELTGAQAMALEVLQFLKEDREVLEEKING